MESVMTAPFNFTADTEAFKEDFQARLAQYLPIELRGGGQFEGALAGALIDYLRTHDLDLFNQLYNTYIAPLVIRVSTLEGQVALLQQEITADELAVSTVQTSVDEFGNVVHTLTSTVTALSASAAPTKSTIIISAPVTGSTPISSSTVGDFNPSGSITPPPSVFIAPPPQTVHHVFV